MIQTWRVTPTGAFKLELDVSSLDEVTQRLPDGYYSTFRTFEGGRRVLGLTSHVQRLYQPVSSPEVGEAILRQRLSTLLEPYRSDEARVRLVMTKQGTIFIALEPLKRLSQDVYEKGVRVETTELQREHPRLKSTSFIARSNSERKHIAKEGIFEALLVKDGAILEGMTSNIFDVIRAEGDEGRSSASSVRRQTPPSAQRAAVLGTAQDGILLGITRQTVLDLARDMGLNVKSQPWKRDQIKDLSEAFITSSSRGVVPVIQIDGGTIGQGSPGVLTKEISAAYEAHVLKVAERI
jgi:branched-chain amino acid aminotransferase